MASFWVLDMERFWQRLRLQKRRWKQLTQKGKRKENTRKTRTNEKARMEKKTEAVDYRLQNDGDWMTVRSRSVGCCIGKVYCRLTLTCKSHKMQFVHEEGFWCHRDCPNYTAVSLIPSNLLRADCIIKLLKLKSLDPPMALLCRLSEANLPINATVAATEAMAGNISNYNSKLKWESFSNLGSSRDQWI